MSDQRNPVEIEDVLSSIRRLVSQDGQAPRRTGLFRAAEAHAPAPPATETKPEVPDTLVLTPALRVVAAPSGAQPAAQAPDLQPDEIAPDLLADAVPDTLDGSAGGWPSDAAFSSDAGQDGALSLDVVPQDAPAPAAEGPEVEGAALVFDPGWPMPVPPAPDLAAPDLTDEISRLENTIAELEAAVAASDETFEPEQGDPFALSGQAAGLAAAFDVDEPAAVEPSPYGTDTPDLTDPHAGAPAAGAEIVAPDAPEFVPPEPEPASGSAAEAVEWVDPIDPREAELTASDWADEAAAPDESLAEPTAARRLHLADAQSAAPQLVSPPSSYVQMQDVAEQELLDADDAVDSDLLGSGEDTLIDEESLRALVSEIIREELQGTLGERITRSVRKLVRREIARALAGRDLQ
ncbi:MAG: hypothetical protein K0B00_04740 [Rhodobacteraceae bacterium]|nr:hypothetical protein [Paracoccaceae bacterium]